MARTRKTPDPEVETPAEEVESPADKVIDTVTHTQQEALQAMEVAGTTLLTGLNEMQREIADFVAKRIREDMETRCARGPDAVLPQRDGAVFRRDDTADEARQRSDGTGDGARRALTARSCRSVEKARASCQT